MNRTDRLSKLLMHAGKPEPHLPLRRRPTLAKTLRYRRQSSAHTPAPTPSLLVILLADRVVTNINS